MEDQANEGETEAKKLILAQMEKAILRLEAHFEQYCKDHQTQTVSMAYIKMSNRLFIDGLRKGINEPSEEVKS